MIFSPESQYIVFVFYLSGRVADVQPIFQICFLCFRNPSWFDCLTPCLWQQRQLSARTTPGVYKSRNPAASHYFQCVSAHWEELEPARDVHYQRQYGFSRSYIKEVMLRFLDCGYLHNGFARVRCHACGHEYLLAFSCKRRHFCPPATRNGWLNSVNGCARKCSNPPLIVNGYFLSQSGYSPGFLMTDNYWQDCQNASGRS